MKRHIQLNLLHEDRRPDTVSAEPSTELGREAVREIHTFAVARLSDPSGQDPAWRVEEEVSRLKHIARKSLEAGGPGTLLELSQSSEFAARLFTEPGHFYRWDVSGLWQTFRDFVEAMVQPEKEAARRIQAIEGRLLPRRTRGWHQAERIGGGHRYGAGRDRRLLFAVDLVAICSKAAAGKRGEAALRDEALVRLCCWSGLRFSENRLPTLAAAGVGAGAGGEAVSCLGPMPTAETRAPSPCSYQRLGCFEEALCSCPAVHGPHTPGVRVPDAAAALPPAQLPGGERDPGARPGAGGLRRCFHPRPPGGFCRPPQHQLRGHEARIDGDPRIRRAQTCQASTGGPSLLAPQPEGRRRRNPTGSLTGGRS